MLFASIIDLKSFVWKLEVYLWRLCPLKNCYSLEFVNLEYMVRKKIVGRGIHKENQCEIEVKGNKVIVEIHEVNKNILRNKPENLNKLN